MFIGCGAAIGFALSVRVGGMLLFGYLSAGNLFAGLTGINKPLRSLTPKVRYILYYKYTSLLLLAWLIMIAFWPWTHSNPFIRPFFAFKAISNFHQPYPILFNGIIYNSDTLPRIYIVKYLSVTTPPVLLSLFFLGFYKMLQSCIKNFTSRESFLILMTLLWFFFPIFYVIIMNPNIYDGIRHFLFILPAMAIIAGYGAAFILNKVRLFIQNDFIPYSIVMIICLFPVKDLVILHPYQMTYFNLFEGGLSKAWRNFDTDYWTSSYKEAAEWLNEQAENKGKKMKVVLAANEFNRLCAEHYLHSNIKVYTFFTGTEIVPDNFDYYVATTRYGLHRHFPDLPVVHSIGRGEAVFTVIKKNSR